MTIIGKAMLAAVAAMMFSTHLHATETRRVSTVEDLVKALDDLKDVEGNTVILEPGHYDVSGCNMLCNNADVAKYLWSTSHIAVSRLTLKGGGDSPRDTVLYGNGTQRILYAWRGVISNLTVSNGCTRAGDNAGGGGVFGRNALTKCYDLVITCCRSTLYGGGVVNAKLYGCEISHCEAARYGGGAFYAYLYDNCLVVSNKVTGIATNDETLGGGISHTDATDSTIMYNLLSSEYGTKIRGAGAYGGTLTRCKVAGNAIAFTGIGDTHGMGGAGYSTEFVDCEIYDNFAHIAGAFNGGSASGCVISNNVTDSGKLTIRNAAFLHDCDINGACFDSPGVMLRTTVRGFGKPWTLSPGANVYTGGVFNADSTSPLITNTQNTPVAATNCLFAENTVSGFLNRPSTTTKPPVVPFVNCTIASNRMDSTIANFAESQGWRGEFINCILCGNMSADGSVPLDFAPNNVKYNYFTLKNCLIGPNRGEAAWSALEETGTVTAVSPGFDSGNAEHPYSITRRSRGLGAGLVQDWMQDANDIRNLAEFPRLREGAVDIGCYQCWLTPAGTVISVR